MVDEAPWRGVRRIRIHVARSGAAASVVFDWRCLRHAAREPGVLLVLGYNTAVLCLPARLAGRRIGMNMDGVEWRRAKWSLPLRVWFFLNEIAGANLATRVVADHPAIAAHVRRRAPWARIATIPYGSHAVAEADPGPLAALGLRPDGFFVSIARIEPENSIETLVEGYLARPRDARLVVLGRFEPDTNRYHARLQARAAGRVDFVGAIYDPAVVTALRVHARAYLHGHTVGGTNPSLVEALGAGSPVIAHDNAFNRYVCGEGQRFFADAAGCDAAMTEFLASDEAVAQARAAAQARHAEAYRWETVLAAYEALIADLAAD